MARVPSSCRRLVQNLHLGNYLRSPVVSERRIGFKICVWLWGGSRIVAWMLLRHLEKTKWRSGVAPWKMMVIAKYISKRNKNVRHIYHGFQISTEHSLFHHMPFENFTLLISEVLLRTQEVKKSQIFCSSGSSQRVRIGVSTFEKSLKTYNSDPFVFVCFCLFFPKF